MQLCHHEMQVLIINLEVYNVYWYTQVSLRQPIANELTVNQLTGY